MGTIQLKTVVAISRATVPDRQLHRGMAIWKIQDFYARNFAGSCCADRCHHERHGRSRLRHTMCRTTRVPGIRRTEKLGRQRRAIVMTKRAAKRTSAVKLSPRVGHWPVSGMRARQSQRCVYLELSSGRHIVCEKLLYNYVGMCAHSREL